MENLAVRWLCLQPSLPGWQLLFRSRLPGAIPTLSCVPCGSSAFPSDESALPPIQRFVCRSVFAYAEGIVRPDELNRLFHQGSHSDSGFHVVGEYEERTAGYDYTSVERHTDTYASHRQFNGSAYRRRNAPLKSPFTNACVFFRKPSSLVELERSARRASYFLHQVASTPKTVAEATRVAGSVSVRWLSNR